MHGSILPRKSSLPCLLNKWKWFCFMDVIFQELSSEIWINYVAPRLPKDDPLRVIQNNFKNTLNIIRAFKRFPHRNTLLGRESTKEEVQFFLFGIQDQHLCYQKFSKAMFLVKIQAHTDKTIIFKEDGSIVRDDSEDGLDTALTQLLVKQPKTVGGGGGAVILSTETISSLHERVSK